MNIFLAFPFAGLINSETKEVSPEYKEFFENLINFIKSRGHTYYSAHEREAWGNSYMGPMECVPHDFDGLKNCDIMIVVPGNPISGGVHIEMGWASALQKNMHIFLDKNIKYSPVVHGLASLTNVRYHNSAEFPSTELFNDICNTIEQEGTNKKCI
ncbi:MAG: nucleoside 2-deoxyribosyltransferase [Alphaproteobacteria bacterium]|nr:nucleoside 2-deoxyribosyltransferase [Alphaproteobacteria bacterium]